MRMLATVVTFAMASPAAADSFDLTDYDKKTHMAASYGLTLTVDVLAIHFDLPRWQAALLGAATTLVVGTTKELVLDEQYDWGDQLANSIGITSATVLVFAFRL